MLIKALTKMKAEFMPAMYLVSKRVIDVLFTSLTLVVLMPFIVLIAILIKIDSPGPVIFRQQRLGRGGRPFTMYKFRTMQHNAKPIRNPDGSHFVGADDSRLTRVGRVLREYSLDEMPQIINVIKGDMSLVGPRPDLIEDLELYDDLRKSKLAVKPGLANFTLLHGRNSLSWDERVELEAFYAAHCCLRLDLEIFLKSIARVLQRKGVYNSEDYQDKRGS